MEVWANYHVCMYFYEERSSNFKEIYELKNDKTQWSGTFVHPCLGFSVVPIQHLFTLSLNCSGHLVGWLSTTHSPFL